MMGQKKVKEKERKNRKEYIYFYDKLIEKYEKNLKRLDLLTCMIC